MDQIQSKDITATESLKRIKEERARLNNISNKVSQIQEAINVEILRLDNLEKHVRNFLI